ncbi:MULTISPECIES: hypothetical protein [unclassified Streptomyces]|uniref:hypothetical protein n=1 Tax=unclassified Streptomyces TaxID=2593676 RepID=UPI000F483CE2|nr:MULTISPECIES: hypothetical protein [unclassified Streptomyces]MCX4771681.1 hypothetical protein [Streptomyces sp. NBC_01285]ROQ80963.1 hypothetical protein EDD95_0502 [Streptomyces sp. CEV 2-1]
METLITVAVVIGMIAVVAFAIHLLNGRNRHRHLAASGPQDHGLTVFRTPAAGRRGGDGRRRPWRRPPDSP